MHLNFVPASLIVRFFYCASLLLLCAGELQTLHSQLGDALPYRGHPGRLPLVLMAVPTLMLVLLAGTRLLGVLAGVFKLSTVAPDARVFEPARLRALRALRAVALVVLVCGSPFMLLLPLLGPLGGMAYMLVGGVGAATSLGAVGLLLFELTRLAEREAVAFSVSHANLVVRGIYGICLLVVCAGIGQGLFLLGLAGLRSGNAGMDLAGASRFLSMLPTALLLGLLLLRLAGVLRGSATLGMPQADDAESGATATHPRGTGHTLVLLMYLLALLAMLGALAATAPLAGGSGWMLLTLGGAAVAPTLLLFEAARLMGWELLERSRPAAGG